MLTMAWPGEEFTCRRSDPGYSPDHSEFFRAGKRWALRQGLRRGYGLGRRRFGRLPLVICVKPSS